MTLRRNIYAGTTLALTALLACACGSGSSPNSASGGSASGSSGSSSPGLGSHQQELMDLYNKAVAKGQTSVVIYGPSAGSDQKDYDAFQKAFPKIKVSGVPVVGPPMDAKLAAEFGSGQHVGDIAYTGGTNMMQYSQKGYFSPFAPVTAPDASGMAAENIGPNNDFYGVTITVAGTVTNSNTVKTPPKTWNDLTGAQYKDKIAMYDPTAIGLMADNFAHLSQDSQYSGLMSGLKANNVQLFPASSITGPLTAVAQGAKAVAPGTGYNFYLGAKSSGAPVAFNLFTADNYTTTLYQGQLKGAPHPLAAQLYEDWLFTPAGAQAIASEGAYSPVKGAVAPAGLPKLSSIPLQKPIPLTDLVAADNAAVTAAKQYWGS